MTIDRAFPLTNTWEPGILRGDEQIDDLRRQILELRETLRETQNQLEYGPIRGQYYPITWTLGDIMTAIGVGGFGRMAFRGTGRPVAVTAAVNVGSLTLDLERFDSVSSTFVTILSSPISVTTSGITIKDRGDFAADAARIGESEVTGLLRPFVDSIDSGIPALLNITLNMKSLSRIDTL